MRLALLQINAIPDFFHFHCIAADDDGGEIRVDQVRHQRWRQCMMCFAIAHNAVFGFHTHDHGVFLDRLADATAWRVFQFETECKRFDFSDFHANVSICFY